MTQTIDVSLPGGVVYVTGTVNGAEYTWTQIGAAWRAVVARADDDRYIVALTAIDTQGVTRTYDLTLYYGLLHLITDRTQADVDRVRALLRKWRDGTISAAERAEWELDLKGAYNASDLNRVGAAVRYVAGRLYEHGYKVAVAPKEDWLVDDDPTAEQMESFRRDIAAIRSALAVKPSTPPAPGSMDGLTYVEANNIEQILLDVDALLTLISQGQFYSGEIYSGEIVGG